MTPHGRFDGTTAVTIHGRGVFLGLRQVLPRLVDGGAVVNAASIGGRVGSIGQAPHVASKHAVIGLTRTAAPRWPVAASASRPSAQDLSREA